MLSCQNIKYQLDILIVQLQYQMRIMIPHQPFFLPHFLGKPSNFSYLIFLGNPAIFPTSFSWETHQFFLPYFLGKPPIFSTPFSWEIHHFFLPHFLGKPTNFSYLIFLGNPPIWLMKLLRETPPHEVFGYYLCYQLEFLQTFHNEGRYH